MEEHETRIVSDFCHQLERSKQLFNGLRDLPQYGHKQWQSYFAKTFDIYTKLWKFQQQHRLVLDHRYGLRRWQIGEIASRIGQLYYHYYLRTSNTSYLHEAFAFYAAIRGRAYYTLRAGKADADLLVKKLRYYARFIVVCLLLKRLKLVRELVAEFGALVEELGAEGGGTASGPVSSCGADLRHEERHEWPRVLQEIGAFLEAESVVTVQDIDSNQVVLSHRLEPSTAFASEGGDDAAVVGPSIASGSPLTLQEIIIVGNCSGQVKFSELTVDMYRMLQTLEREQSEAPAAPGATACHTPPGALSPHVQNGTANGSSRRENPHKYLLYRPTFCQLMAFLASGFKELPVGGIMLLYLSADGCFSTPSTLQNGSLSSGEMYELGGVCTDGRQRDSDSHQPSLLLDSAAVDQSPDSWQKQKQRQRQPSGRNPNCFYPGDLLPFTRKPLLLIVDSDNASVFRCLVSTESPASSGFRQPLVVLMSSRLVPPAHSSRSSCSVSSGGGGGRLLTLFLHSPLLALCHVCNLASISVHTWEQCRRLLDSVLAHTARALSSCRALPAGFVPLMHDEFVRALLLRFVVCRLVLQQHRAFGGAGGVDFVPQCAPPLPDAQLMACAPLMRSLRELFTQLDARHLLVTLPTDKEGATAASEIL